jgi:hypothetical protein
MKNTFSAIGIAILASLALGVIGCSGGDPPSSLMGDEPAPEKPDKKYDNDPTDDPAEQPGAANGGEDNSFEHPSLGGGAEADPFEVLAEREEEGPPEVRTRLHSCQKLQIDAVANVLASFGVDLGASNDPPTAGDLLDEGAGALGGPNYDARIGEAIVWSAAGAARLFDIFVQAAPDIIANIENAPQCQVAGQGFPMFVGDECNEPAVTCLIGRPATPEHLAICNDLVKSATDVDTGKGIAVATLLSAAHSCE